MADWGFQEMQQIQKELQEKYKDKWGGLSPQIGRDKLLWMMVEAGEMENLENVEDYAEKLQEYFGEKARGMFIISINN